MLIAGLLTLPALYGFITGPAADGTRHRGPAPAASIAASRSGPAEIVLRRGGGATAKGLAVATKGDVVSKVFVGPLQAGSQRRLRDVLRLENRSDEALPVRVTVSAGIRPSLRVPRGVRYRLLQPGEDLELSVDAVPRADAPPGAYDGVVTVDQGSDGNLYTIPVHLEVIPGPRDVLPKQ